MRDLDATPLQLEEVLEVAPGSVGQFLALPVMVLADWFSLPRTAGVDGRDPTTRRINGSRSR